MKISSMECGKAVETQVSPDAVKQETIIPQGKTSKSSLEKSIEHALKVIAELPDIREDAVSEVEAQVQSGQYNISGEDIADMMVRRLKADRIR